MDKTINKSRLRNKGQVTVPLEIRNLLGAEEGDNLLFFTDEAGRVVISRAQIIDPIQAWFWSDRWQRMEQEAQPDLEAGRIVGYAYIADALAALDEILAGDEIPADDDVED
jgi:antitoxin MazE